MYSETGGLVNSTARCSNDYDLSYCNNNDWAHYPFSFAKRNRLRYQNAADSYVKDIFSSILIRQP